MTTGNKDQLNREEELFALRLSLEKFADNQSIPEEWKEEFLGHDFLFQNASIPQSLEVKRDCLDLSQKEN